MSLEQIKSQEDYVVGELLKNGKISRNQCLQRYITRLGALIYIIKNKNSFSCLNASFSNSIRDFLCSSIDLFSL